MRERRRELARHALEGYPDGPAAALVAGGSRRKLRYARILVEAMPAERMPPPLLAALERVSAP
jgi:hypothetical protein